MADSTVVPDNFIFAIDRRLGAGKGTSSLSPSGTRDGYIDLLRGLGLGLRNGFDCDSGKESDMDQGGVHITADPDAGDSECASDTDSNVTGRRAAVRVTLLFPRDVTLRLTMYFRWRGSRRNLMIPNRAFFPKCVLQEARTNVTAESDTTIKAGVHIGGSNIFHT